MLKLAKLLLWISVISWVTAWSFWMFFGCEFFEIGQAFAIFGFTSALIIILPKSKITKIAFTIATNQLADELFFNPFKISWNEYLTIFVLIGLILFNTYLNKLATKLTTILKQWSRRHFY